MGCGGYSKINKPDLNGAVYRKITKEDVRIDVGKQVKLNQSGPVIVFVYGGPGSKKGRLVSELIEVFDFTFINVEKIMLQKMTKLDSTVAGSGDSNIASLREQDNTQTNNSNVRKESLQELKKMLEDDPSTVSLRWILHEVCLEVEKNPTGRFLVDMMPNLKYIIRTANFSQDCSTSMAEFENKLPISFSVYFSLNMGSKKSRDEKQEEVKEEKEDDSAGFQSDEVDLSRTKRRASMFENSVRNFLEYFEDSERLVSVDVSSRNVDAICSRVYQTFSRLSLCNQKLVNTILIFIFDSKGVDPDQLLEYDVEYILLEKEGTKLTIGNLDEAIESFVTLLNHKEHKTYVVDLTHTAIDKDTDVEVTKAPSQPILFINEDVDNGNFSLPGCQGVYKTVSSLENVVCVFPGDTNNNLCKKIAASFNKEFATPRNGC